jgi:hypothetical protein
MVTKLDMEVIRYLRFLDSPKPAAKDHAAICHWLDEADRLRFVVLDKLIRKPRYSGVLARRAWKGNDNPHRPAIV